MFSPCCSVCGVSVLQCVCGAAGAAGLRRGAWRRPRRLRLRQSAARLHLRRLPVVLRRRASLPRWQALLHTATRRSGTAALDTNWGTSQLNSNIFVHYGLWTCICEIVSNTAKSHTNPANRFQNTAYPILGLTDMIGIYFNFANSLSMFGPPTFE